MLKKTVKYVCFALMLLCIFAICAPKPWLSKAYAIPRNWVRIRMGNFTGPISGTAQDDNIKASTDLLNAKIAAQYGCSGNVWFVDSGVAGSGGTDWTTAVGTLDQAVDLATSNNGDLILVAAGHSEVIGEADAIDVDKHLIKIVGMGSGELRPTFDATDVAGEFVIAGDDVVVENLRFLADISDVLVAIDVEAGAEGATIRNCVFEVNLAGTDEFTDCIYIRAGSDRAVIENCRFRMGAGGANAAISTLDSDYMRVIGNEIYGDYGVACINSITTASDHITIKDNVMFNGTIGGNAGLNAQPCIELMATDSGTIVSNKLFCNVATVAAAVVGADMFLVDNWYGEDEGPGSTAVDWAASAASPASITPTTDG